MSGLSRAIRRLQDNPIWAAAGTLFGLCFWFAVNQEYAWPEVNAALFRRHAEIQRLQDTYLRGTQMVEIWKGALANAQDSAVAIDGRLTPQFLRRKRGPRDSVTAWLLRERRMFSAPIASLRVTVFDDAPMLALQAQLLGDLIVADSIIERRMRLMELMHRDPRRAELAAPGVLGNLEEARQVLQGSTRYAEIDRVLDNARVAFNVAVKADNADRSMLTVRSRATVAAWTYIGGFIGAILGFALHKHRKSRPAGVSPPKRAT